MLEGRIFIYNPSSKLVAFESGASNPSFTVILIGGLCDGLLSLPYCHTLSTCISSINGSLVQPLLSSSYHGYGCSSLASDSSELVVLLKYLQSAKQRPIILVGHSTGCQNILHLLHSPNSHPMEVMQTIKAAILQGPASDRQYYLSINPSLSSALPKEAPLEDSIEGKKLMSQLFDGIVPITTYRLASLLLRMGDDDYFSDDLTDAELLLKHSSRVPLYIFVSENDEYMPEDIDKTRLIEKWKKAWENVVDAFIIENASHALDTTLATAYFCSKVVQIAEISLGTHEDNNIS